MKLSPSKLALSVRLRLVLLAVLAIAPLLVGRVHRLQEDRAERIAAAYADATDLARRGLEAHQETLTAARAVLQVVARTQSSLVTAGDQCGSLLSAIARDAPFINSLSIVAPAGRIVCSTVFNAVGADLSDRPYFRDALASRRFIMSHFVQARRDKAPTLMALAPVLRPDDTLAGIVAAGVDLQWADRLGETLSERPGSLAVLADGDGIVLATYPPSDAWFMRRLPNHPLIAALAEGPSGTVATVGPDGKRRMFGFLRLSGVDASLAVGVDEDTVLADINHTLWDGYLELGLVCGLVMACVWLAGGRLIIEPIRSLTRAAVLIGRGHLTGRLSNRGWAAEFAPLAAALDEMARRLAMRERELSTTNVRLEQLANRDGLSGLANRRSFDQRLTAEWQQLATSALPLTLLMIDVDHFKSFNDHYGHVVGDACLRKVAGVLSNVAESHGGFAARYGGEEFALLLPGGDRPTALTIGEQVRGGVEKLRVVHVAAPLHHVSVSIGGASIASAIARPQDLVEAADSALYAAKRGGRNRVVVFDPQALPIAS